MLLLWITLMVPLVWTSPVPVADLEEAVDVLLTSVEAHERKIKSLQDEMYHVGDVLEEQAFLLKQLKEIIEDKKDPGYADEIGAEEVEDSEVEEQLLTDELQKIRNQRTGSESSEEEVAVGHPAEVLETQEEIKEVEPIEEEQGSSEEN